MFLDYKSKLLDLKNLENKKVFLRVDLNINFIDNKIIDDTKLKAILPTLDFLISKKVNIILATHIGRPKKYIKNLSTENLLYWFIERGYNFVFVNKLEDLKFIKNSLVLFENLRFFEGEQTKNLVCAQKFALELSCTADFYVNDAFGVLHRLDTSLVLVAQRFDKEHKTIGFLVEKELIGIKLFLNNNNKLLVILGGGKVDTKLPVIYKLLDKIDSIALCPALVFTFLKAQNISVGKSFVENNLLDYALKIIEKAKLINKNIIYPKDYLVAQDNFNNKLLPDPVKLLSGNQVGVTIGPETVEKFKFYIENSSAIFLNAAMGDLKRPETIEILKKLLYEVAQAKAYTVIGGGQTVAAANIFGLTKYFSYCSTGGGVILDILAGNQLLALEVLDN